jgi:D-3-phosphoglycerate dehydrogenase
MKILHLDTNHPCLISGLQELGFENDEDYISSKEDVENKIHHYDGIIIRSRFKIDKRFIEKANKLKFIGRVGAGLESIDIAYAKKKGVHLLAAPEGNRNAVGEHALGMILALFNKLKKADIEIRKGKWLREDNRGIELEGKTIGIIGYGNMGKAFAKKLKGFDTEVIYYDILKNIGDKNARQVELEELFEKTHVLSLHTPQTELTDKMVDKEFIKSENLPEAFQYLIRSDKILMSPHVAGWTVESKKKLAQTIVDKVKLLLLNLK